MIVDIRMAMRINGYIQRKLGTLWLFGKQVESVALDGSCMFVSKGIDEIALTEEQVLDLFNQTYGAAPATKAPTSGEPRDTQFAGFAKLLWKDISIALNFIDFGFDAAQQESFDKHIEKVIAQRGYDLVKHTCEEIERREDLDERYWLGYIPDLTAWPQETK